MSWVRLDDKFHRNPKVLAMSDAAHRIYVDLISYCADVTEPTGFLTDVEASSFVRARGKSAKVLEELLTLRALERVHDGFLLHDFPEYLVSTSRDRTRQWRDKKRDEDVTPGDVTVTSRPVTDPSRVTSPERHGDAPKRHLARANPVPVPVKEASPPLSNVSSNTREALAICHAVEGLGGVITPRKLEDAEGLVAEFRVPTAEEFVQAIKAHPPNGTVRSVVYFRQRFRELNDSLRDAGRKPRGHDNGSREEGFGRIAGAALPPARARKKASREADPDDD